MRLCCSVVWCIGLLCVFALACGGGDCDNPNPNYDASDPSSQSCLDPVPTNGVGGGQVDDSGQLGSTSLDDVVDTSNSAEEVTVLPEDATSYDADNGSEGPVWEDATSYDADNGSEGPVWEDATSSYDADNDPVTSYDADEGGVP